MGVAYASCKSRHLNRPRKRTSSGTTACRRSGWSSSETGRTGSGGDQLVSVFLAGVIRQNHWFDAMYNACAAGRAYGVRLVDEQMAKPSATPALDRNNRVSKEWMDQFRDWGNWKRMVNRAVRDADASADGRLRCGRGRGGPP
jgi:hypothetical protein